MDQTLGSNSYHQESTQHRTPSSARLNVSPSGLKTHIAEFPVVDTTGKDVPPSGLKRSRRLRLAVKQFNAGSSFEKLSELCNNFLKIALANAADSESTVVIDSKHSGNTEFSEDCGFRPSFGTRLAFLERYTR